MMAYLSLLARIFHYWMHQPKFVWVIFQTVYEVVVSTAPAVAGYFPSGLGIDWPESPVAEFWTW